MNMGDQVGIDPARLREWLEAGHPVEIIDIRRPQDFDSWHIPGSQNLDVYGDIQLSRPGLLATYEAPTDRTVVAVCYVGETSQIAANYLRSRAIPAYSLAGGMMGWSLAWNTARVNTRNEGTYVVQIRRTGKGCLSYVIASHGECAILDPSVDPSVYLEMAKQHGWRIIGLVDSHIHADHFSRSLHLAGLTDAPYHLPRQARAEFEYTPIDDGTEIAIGPLRLVARRTPGHTPESVCFLIEGEAVFTGDTLFLDGVGRPDLGVDFTELKERAVILHRSLQTIGTLDPELLVLPAHASHPIPFDRRPLSLQLMEVVARVEPLSLGEAEFVKWITSRRPPNPPNYKTIVQRNERGAPLTVDSIILEAGANNCAA